jgi:protein TonB
METKKSKKADLENKRILFLQIGFILSLGAALLAFEWPSSDVSKNDMLTTVDPSMALELPPITRSDEPKKVELPKPKPLELIEIVDNNSDAEELDPFSSEGDPDLAITPVNYDVESEDGDSEPIPFVFLEDKPEFPGGMDEMFKFIARNVKYPSVCQELGIEGVVYVSFVIDKTGKVTNVQLMRGVDKNLDAEALRVVALMPDWKPGKQRNVPVRVAFNMPVRFKLQ